MAKFIPDAILDQQLNLLEGDNVHVCSQQPTTYTEAATTYQLATQAITAPNMVISNGDAGGRKLTYTPPTGTTISNTGTGTHLAVTSGTTLLLVTTCNSLALTASQTVDINPFSHTVGDTQ